MSTAAAAEKAAPLTDRGRRTREKLLTAARREFEERGYAGTRMADIARAAGVSHGTTYTWFADKEAVLRAIVDEMLAEVYAALALSDDLPDPEQRMLEANRRCSIAIVKPRAFPRIVPSAAARTDCFST